MQQNEFFVKSRAGKTVFKRTRKVGDLPEFILYMGPSAEGRGRRVVNPEGESLDLEDKVIVSNYRSIPGGQAKAAIEKYWQNPSADSQ